MTQTAAIIHRFRGTWVSGQAYDARDIAVTGRWSFEATMDHVAGQQSQPGHGAHWTRYWRPIEGFGVVEAPARGQPLPAPPATATILHLPAPVPLGTGVAVEPDEAGAPVRPAADGALPAHIPSASEIPDDSDIGLPNLGMALSWIKAMLKDSVRRAELADDLRHLEEQMKALADRIGAVLQPCLSPVQAEALTRKARVYGVETDAEVTAAEMKMMRAQIRLLRKRDTGEAYTAQDAAMATILDSMSRAIGDIDEAAEALEHSGAADVASDQHWPQIGARP